MESLKRFIYVPRLYLRGFKTYLIGFQDSDISRGTGGTVSARYCYSIWLRHLVMAHKHGLLAEPKVVAELGPGDSLGIGLSALLSGADRLYAVDVGRYASTQRNIEVFDELVELFRRREPIPDEAEFPEAMPALTSYEFPSHILGDRRLGRALRQDRIAAIRKSILGLDDECEDKITYIVGYREDSIKEGYVDIIFSQAVLEHVDNIQSAYTAMRRWLKPGGFISHQIDFRCHDTSLEWNGHWRYSDFSWRLIRGRRHYFINRQPHSAHIDLMEENGFRVVCDDAVKGPAGISASKLSSRFKDLSGEDLATVGAFIQAVKVE